MNETEIRDKTIRDCAMELLRRAKIIEENAMRSMKLYGKEDKQANIELQQSLTLTDAARDLMTMRSESPVMKMMKDFRG